MTGDLKCGVCDGTGKIEHVNQNTGATTLIPCGACGGTGRGRKRPDG